MNRSTPTLGLFTALLASPALGATIIDADFNAAAPGTYGGQTGDIATTLDGFDVSSDTAAGNVVTVTSGTDRAAQFTLNNALFVTPGSPLLSAGISGASTDGTGNNVIEVTFNYTRFTAGAGNPLFQFYLQEDGALSASLSDRALQVQVNGNNGSLLYWGTAAGSIDSGVDLAVNTEYVFSITLDLSSTTQDSYGFSVAPAASPSSPVFSVSNVSTAVADVLPDVLVFRGGGNPVAAGASPFAQIDNVNAVLVPEPGAFGLAFAGAGLMLGRRRR